MSDRMYLYEVADDTWHDAPPAGGPGAALATEVARWAGLHTDEDQSFLVLPGYSGGDYFGAVAYCVGFHEGVATIVSTVPLSWLPEHTRRGFATLGGAK